MLKKFQITVGDVLSALPFNSDLVKISVNGSKLIEVLEWSVLNLEPNDTADLDGRFLQMSGIHVVYDLSQPSGSRVFSVYLRCASCKVPTFEKLENDAMYNIITSGFVRGGGNGYSMLMDLKYTVAGNYLQYFEDLWQPSFFHSKRLNYCFFKILF